MLMLTKLDKTRILVPVESIKYIEETPDTLIRFLNGELLMVRERLEEILGCHQTSIQGGQPSSLVDASQTQNSMSKSPIPPSN
jgi:uncharacterized protein YlzI (FlbEa/FlbD family)